MTEPRRIGEIVPEVLADLLRRAADPRFERWAEQVQRAGHCTHPVRLTGDVVAFTGQQRERRYDTVHEPDRVLLVACGNRREAVCPSCADVYRHDTHQLVAAGLRGGKGVPETVAEHPRLFVTLTAPSFGAVHRAANSEPGGRRQCRPRRERPCLHGVARSCQRVHRDGDPATGRPLCADCYDYEGAVLFNALAPELWRRTTVYIRQHLARLLGMSRRELGERMRLSYAKVAEYQRRGVVHFHAVVRLDAADPTGHRPPPAGFTTELLDQAVRAAVASVWVAAPEVDDGRGERRLGWGVQLDVRTITGAPTRDGALTAAAVASYVAKYATKATECVEAPPKRLTGREDLDALGVDPHIARMIRTCWCLATLASCEELNLHRWAHMLGFRGHFSTKSRRYSTTLGALRHARAEYRARRDTAVRGDDPETVVVGRWNFAGTGYGTRGDALLAATAAARAREHRDAARLARLLDPDPPPDPLNKIWRETCDG